MRAIEKRNHPSSSRFAWSGRVQMISLQNVAAFGSLDLQIVQLVGGVAHPGLQPELLRLFAQPQAASVTAANPAKIILPEPEHGAVVDHAAIFITHRGVHHLPDREATDVARDAGLQQ